LVAVIAPIAIKSVFVPKIEFGCCNSANKVHRFDAAVHLKAMLGVASHLVSRRLAAFLKHFVENHKQDTSLRQFDQQINIKHIQRFPNPKGQRRCH
jgi:hypothetical protein